MNERAISTSSCWLLSRLFKYFNLISSVWSNCYSFLFVFFLQYQMRGCLLMMGGFFKVMRQKNLKDFSHAYAKILIF